ncbi:hypothetical protein MTR67_040549 [Solanum verrucosum]|uniref:Uncharacterized protein n=1 Tax=Solanum verrucosum TaxID=315347 RepID=A0AAF0ZS80_SOLVR|nr:hypothetical protein MTR67_040549 [Solanum verrucosum]
MNHRVDTNIISNVHRYMVTFFDLPLFEKQKAQRKISVYCCYASSVTGRY